MILRARLLPLIALGAVFATAARAQDSSAAIRTALADVARPPADLSRDDAQHAAELLALSSVHAGGVVLELQPGQGYWTRLFSQLVGPKGHVFAFALAPPRMPASPNAPPGTAPAVRPANNAVIAPIVALQHVSGYQNILGIQAGVGSGDNLSVGIPLQADVVWSARSYHDLHAQLTNVTALDAALWRDLKPGGLFIVIDNVAAKGTGIAAAAALHRIEQTSVEQEAQAAGFVLVTESSLLAQSGDDHTAAVEVEASVDQFVLVFRKPSSASAADRRLRDAVAMKNIYGNTFVLGTADQRFRTIFYHPDHTYQEFGLHDMQAAYWYWDADGHNCMYHQFPVTDEGFTTCHPWSDAHTHAQLGVSFHEYGPSGQAATVTVVPGHQYPNSTQWISQ